MRTVDTARPVQQPRPPGPRPLVRNGGREGFIDNVWRRLGEIMVFHHKGLCDHVLYNCSERT